MCRMLKPEPPAMLAQVGLRLVRTPLERAPLPRWGTSIPPCLLVVQLWANCDPAVPDQAERQRTQMGVHLASTSVRAARAVQRHASAPGHARGHPVTLTASNPTSRTHNRRSGLTPAKDWRGSQARSFARVSTCTGYLTWIPHDRAITHGGTENRAQETVRLHSRGSAAASPHCETTSQIGRYPAFSGPTADSAAVAMVAAWVASLPCSPGPPLSGGTAVAVTAASLPTPAGVSARAYRRISVLPAATCMFQLLPGRPA
jgi:hypothetical protein